MDSSAVAPRKAPKLATKSFTSHRARASLSVTQTFRASGMLVSSSGDSRRTRAWPRPCGETTTRKKLTRVTNGPSGLSLRYMPGFSPDQSTVPACIGVSMSDAAHHTLARPVERPADGVLSSQAMNRHEIPTPALLLDLDRFERNVQKMAAFVKEAGKKLRPHAKTHKCPEIARRQIAAGAVGVCVAKVGEAEAMAAAGVRNLLVTTEVVGSEKIGRLLGVLERQPETMVVVDHPDNVRELGEAMTRARRVLNVLVDVDVLGRRTGVQPGEPALALGRAVVHEPALNLRGLQGYAGHCAHVIGWEERRRTSRRCMARLMKTREVFEKNGLAVDVVSGGSSGTYNIDSELEGLTELQSGSYCVMDLDYRRIGGRSGSAYDDFEMALTVLTTVISVPSAEMAMIDAGLKSRSE